MKNLRVVLWHQVYTGKNKIFAVLYYVDPSCDAHDLINLPIEGFPATGGHVHALDALACRRILKALDTQIYVRYSCLESTRSSVRSRRAVNVASLKALDTPLPNVHVFTLCELVLVALGLPVLLGHQN